MPTFKPKLSAAQGSVMAQWCIAALPLLLLGSAAIEASEWHATRQRLALAVQLATDDASMTGGTSQSLSDHLRKHLPSDLTLPIEACITDPVHALMADFMDKRLSLKLGKPVIRHNHVNAQHKDSLSKGRPQGRGPRSGKTISEANMLNVEAVATYRVRSPWIRKIVGPVKIRLKHRAVMQSHRQRLSQRCVKLN